MTGRVHLLREFFSKHRARIFDWQDFYAETFLFASGVEGLILGNERGHITVLPYMGQMVWDALFDGVDLTMKNMFSQPLPKGKIIETYGCYLYHAGILRCGCPSPEDTHVLHGEIPCAPMDDAKIIFGYDEKGVYLGVAGSYEYVMGFGDHYLAEPSIKLRADSGVFDVEMRVTNLSGVDMELMYMCHINSRFDKDAEIVQPMAYTRENIITRTSVPAHVRPTPEWLAFLETVAKNPEQMEKLADIEQYDPEFVFFLKNMEVDEHGQTHFLMKGSDGSSCYCSYFPEEFSHTVRWILANANQQVAAFALPATCEPEGYLREREKGNIKHLAAGETKIFRVETGYLSGAETGIKEELIQIMKGEI